MSNRVVHVPELSRPACPLTAAFIHRHPDKYADLVDPAMRGQFQRPGGT